MARHFLNEDPAIEKWAYMRENTLRNFKVTPRTLRYGLIGGILVPSFFYWCAATFNYKFDRQLLTVHDDVFANFKKEEK
ncbi:hypothetical protein DFJ74DRAFT_481282 [Hyaloraphidium curvatum]|nr:hypothetical protein DFJ74DRAFT_481282 [Hyaloraphidium curvatum]